MKEWFSGFDMLDTQEYAEIMEIMAEDDTKAMQEEIAATQAANYFENELDKDYEGR